MGWKSTKMITRQQAIDAIKDNIHKCDDENLSSMLESLNDGTDHPLGYGLNFMISHEIQHSCPYCNGDFHDPLDQSA